MKTTIINVEGMSCGHCANAVKNLIQEIDGIRSVSVELSSKEARVEFDSDSTNTVSIIEKINNSEIYKATQK